MQLIRAKIAVKLLKGCCCGLKRKSVRLHASQTDKCECSSFPVVSLITKKPIIPSEEEINQNSRSAPSKFRVIEKLREIHVS